MRTVIPLLAFFCPKSGMLDWRSDRRILVFERIEALFKRRRGLLRVVWSSESSYAEFWQDINFIIRQRWEEFNKIWTDSQQHSITKISWRAVIYTYRWCFITILNYQNLSGISAITLDSILSFLVPLDSGCPIDSPACFLSNSSCIVSSKSIPSILEARNLERISELFQRCSVHTFVDTVWLLHFLWAYIFCRCRHRAKSRSTFGTNPWWTSLNRLYYKLIVIF